MGAQPHPTRPERLRPPARKPEAALVALLLLLVAAVVPVPCGAQQRSSAAPPAAASPPAPPPADLPSLAELVPKARELGEDGARLETRIVKITDVREAEASLAVLRERHAAAAAALKELETAGDYTLDRLTRLRESFRQDAAAVDAVVGDLTGRMEEIEGDRKRWSELHAVWSAWEAQVPKKDAGAAVRVTFSEARASLAHAAGLLSQAVPQVVPVQRRAVELQAQFQELRTKVEGLVSAIKGGLFGRWAWPMYSEQFRDQLRASLDLGLVASPARFTALRNQVSPSWGWLALVHVLLFAGFSFALRWSRTAGVHGETWRGLLERPFAAGAIAGALIPVAFYSPFQKLPAFVAFALSLCAALATARLAPRLIASRVLRRALFVVVGVFLADRFFRFVGLPTPPLRVWNALTGAAGSVLCFVGSARWRRRGEPAALLFACRAAGTLFAVACAGQVLGYTSLGFRLTDGLLWSTFLVPLGWIFSLLLRGSAELLLDRAALARWPLLRTRRDEILRTLGIVTDGASLCLFAAIFLVVWRVLDTPREAIAFLLDLGVTWGTQR
ncbi:MAG: hypothetical protein HGA98_03340, partial [Deltaproteobacteria bacterium]|nr:hypothetical protein [Deltaproteobacteria bacterium]